MRRVTAIVLAIMMFFSSTVEVWASELEKSNSSSQQEQITYPTGLQEVEAIGIPQEEMTEEIYDYHQILEMNVLSEVYNDEWDKYSTNYFYNQLSAEEKEFWDAMDIMCLNYMNTSVDVTDRTLEAISVPDGMTKERLGVLWNLFTYSNPQYYFLLNSYSYTYNPSTGMVFAIILMCYDDFCDGESRALATAEVKEQIEEWEDVVKEYTTDEEKVKVIFDLICNKVYYDDEAAAGGVSEQDSFSQSTYSVLCMDKTVCAGYSDTLTLMCNGVGIDAVAVTSNGHQWNKIRINDSWYNYDATWGDQASGIYYKFYARNDYIYDTYTNASAHQEKEFWIPYLPKCTLDTDPSNPWSGPGIYPQILNVTATPEITVTKQTGNYLVSITSSTPNADIYYTVDGSTPSVAFGKSIKYTEPFIIEDAGVVKAIAVCDTYFDSNVTNEDVIISIEDTVILLDGINNDSDPISYDYDGTEKKPVVTVMYGENTLVKGLDYTVTYENCVNAGNAKVVITGIGNYSGTISKVFTINKASINSAEVTLSENSYTYDGSEKKPNATVKLRNKTLSKDADYTVSYKNNTAAGTATVIITGIGNYSGTVRKTFTIDAPIKDGWVQKNGNWYYYENGTAQTGWIKDAGKWYYMNGSGVMQTGWVKVGNKWYYMSGSGAMQTGWVKVGSKWYYMSGSGAMQTGWVKDGSKWYYMSGSGAMQTGWVNDGDTWYYMNGSGAMQSNGWIWDGSNWYYLHKNGAMLSDSWLWHGNNWYYLTKSGQMATDWVYYNSDYYYMNDDGIMQSNDWVWDDNNWYYLDADGIMLSSTWLLEDGRWYYLEKNGAMATEKWIGNYYVTESGVMATNQWVDNNTYYVDGSGLVVSNIHQVDLGNGNYTTIYGEYNEDFEKEVIRLVNEYRIENGLNPLETEEYLSKQTDIRGYEISHEFSHTRPNGTSCFTVLSKGGYGWMGENIAAGHKSPQEVFNAWRNSQGHNANMLNENFELIGVSCFVEEGTNRCHWVQMFASK